MLRRNIPIRRKQGIFRLSDRGFRADKNPFQIARFAKLSARDTAARKQRLPPITRSGTLPRPETPSP
ncbi:MAG: hypothetical protein HT580_06390 [Dechloromonas sp.]|nr:MAG: hypothetical protein HT580_06390 [Dechloromonas sp.]